MPTASTLDAFRNTRWSLVADLQQPQCAQSRLDELCIRYWAPVQAFFASRGCDADTATRMTRGFFDHLVNEGVARAGDHGSFRMFLLHELERYLVRSGPGDDSPALPDTGERALRHGFAVEVIAGSMQRLRDEAVEAGRLPVFERLQRYLSSEGSSRDYRSDANALGVHPLFVAMAVQRLRQRFRHLVNDELAQLTRNSDEFEAERQALREALERTP